MRWSLLLMLMLCCTSAAAQTAESHAEPLGGQLASSAPSERQWYGWQNLAVSVPTLALTLGGLVGRHRGVAMAGAAGFVLGSPIVHWTRGEAGNGFLSLGMQVLIPAVAGGVGVYVSGEGEDAAARNLTGFVVGACVGALASLLIDAFVLAFDGEGTSASTMNFASTQPPSRHDLR